MIANSIQQVTTPQESHTELMKDCFREVFLILRWSYMGFRFRLAMIKFREKMNERRGGLRNQKPTLFYSSPLSNAFFDHSTLRVREKCAKHGFLSFGHAPSDSTRLPDIIQLIQQHI